LVNRLGLYHEKAAFVDILGEVVYKAGAMFLNGRGHHGYWYHHHAGGGLTIVQALNKN
jgi:hypothetical protein